MPTVLLIGDEVLDPDVTITESFLSSAVVTMHPVEEGADVSDHVQEQPLQVTLELVITKSPIRRPSFGADGVTVLSAAPVFQLSGSLDDRARLLSDRLRATRGNGELATLQSSRRGTIENLAVQSISEPYTSVQAVTLSVSLVQIRVADARAVVIPETLQPRGKKKKDQGKKPTEALTEERSRSLLLKSERQARKLLQRLF